MASELPEPPDGWASITKWVRVEPYSVRPMQPAEIAGGAYEGHVSDEPPLGFVYGVVTTGEARTSTTARCAIPRAVLASAGVDGRLRLYFDNASGIDFEVVEHVMAVAKGEAR